MKFKFIGNGDNDPDEITCFGMTFPKGKAVTVPNELLPKIENNSHFQQVKARKNNVKDEQ